MAIHEVRQGSTEWLSLRLGKVTASRVAAATAKSITHSGPGISRTKYMEELIYEHISGQPYEYYRSASMDWGLETEPLARAAYERHLGVSVLETGFVDHPFIPMSGASPDGLVGGEGLVEIKCPNSHTHLETIRKGRIAGKYIKQMRWQMACTRRRWCDFVSYDPRVPQKNRLFIKRIHADHEIEILEKAVIEFVKDLKKSIRELS